MFKRVTISLLLLILSAPYLYSAESPRPFVIAIQPTATAEELQSQAKELEEFLETRLGRDVVIKFPTSYAGVVEALRFGHAQAAFMSAWPAALATDKADAEVVLAEVRQVKIGEESKEMPYYYSYWVVPASSAYKSLSELKGKRVAFSNQLSTSGYVAPLARLVELGYVTKEEGKPADPNTFFGDSIFAGGYSQAWEALKSGQVDTTVIAGDVPEKLYNEVLSQTKILEQQGPIPSHAVVFSKQLPAQEKEAVLNALLELNDPQYQPLMRKFISGIFVRFQPADESHLASLKQMIDSAGLEFQDKK